MSERHDDTRWRDGAAPIEHLAEALVAYSEQGASEAELARLRAVLAPQLAQPTQSATSAATGWSSTARIGTWVSVALIGVAAMWSVDGGDAARTSKLDDSAPQAATVQRQAPARELTVAPEPDIATAPAARSREVALPSARHKAKQIPRATVAPPPAGPLLPPPSIEAELELLRNAQSALNRSASAALALANEHARLYPQGAFVEEREMLRIEAELTLGQRRSALERARAFSEAFGRSTYRARIERLLAAHDALKDQEPTPAERTQ